jgi:hypothetical protein
MALIRFAPAVISGCLLGFGGLALPALAASDTPAPAGAAANDKGESLVYIFSGGLTEGETYSGTLVAAADGPEFELKLSKGGTCDASKLEPDKGLLRLPETVCSDGRKLKALLVYQPGNVLRIYGAIGDQRFSAQAHALPSGAVEVPSAPAAAPPANLMDKAK